MLRHHAQHHAAASSSTSARSPHSSSGPQPHQQQQQRLKGLLRLIEAQLPRKMLFLDVYEFDAQTLQETQSALQKSKRRKQRRRDNRHQSQTNASGPPPAWQRMTLEALLSGNTTTTTSTTSMPNHRFVGFFVVQGNDAHRYSRHTLMLRKRLALEYHNVLTTILIEVPGDGTSSSSDPFTPIKTMPLVDDGTLHTENNNIINNNNNNNNNNHAIAIQDQSYNLLAAGTGFACLDYNHGIILHLLNVTQLPALIVIDATTGRKVSKDDDNDGVVLWAVEHNDAEMVLEEWQRGKSGLTCCQQVLAIVTCESRSCCPCIIS